MFVLQPRGVAVYASVPLALLIGLAWTQCIVPGLERLQENQRSLIQGLRTPSYCGRISPIILIMSTLLVLYGVFGAFLNGMRIVQEQTLNRDEREALDWISRHTPSDARFLVLTAQDVWQDPTSEWFPVLTGRVSVATVQGYEWLPQSHNLRWQQFEMLQKCATEDASCVAQWSEKTQRTFDFLYLRRAPAPHTAQWRHFEASLRANHYHQIYNGQAASVWKR
jgi:hypothetical protein